MSASLASGLALPDSTLVDLVIPRKSLVLDFIVYLISRSLSLETCEIHGDPRDYGSRASMVVFKFMRLAQDLFWLALTWPLFVTAC